MSQMQDIDMKANNYDQSRQDMEVKILKICYAYVRTLNRWKELAGGDEYTYVQGPLGRLIAAMLDCAQPFTENPDLLTDMLDMIEYADSEYVMDTRRRQGARNQEHVEVQNESSACKWGKNSQ